jgi:hypothetical protein
LNKFDVTWQYFNKEEHLKLEALVKKLRRQIEVRSLNLLYECDFLILTLFLLQPTADEHAADKKSLEGILAMHKISANENVSSLVVFYAQKVAEKSPPFRRPSKIL